MGNNRIINKVKCFTSPRISVFASKDSTSYDNKNTHTHSKNKPRRQAARAREV